MVGSVNVTSGAAHGVSGYLAAYGSAKHALDALTATVDLEASAFGVRAVSVVPGTYPTTGVAANVMLAPEIEPYGDGHVKLVRALENAFGDRTDYSVVTDAILNAATSPEPDFIALAGPELAARTGPVIAAGIPPETAELALVEAPKLRWQRAGQSVTVLRKLDSA